MDTDLFNYVAIYNTEGQIMFEYGNLVNNLIVNTSNYPNGAYIIVAQNDYDFTTKKLIRKKKLQVNNIIFSLRTPFLNY